MIKYSRYIAGSGGVTSGGKFSGSLSTEDKKRSKSNLIVSVPEGIGGNSAEAINRLNKMTSRILSMTDNNAVRIAVKKEVGRTKGDIKAGFSPTNIDTISKTHAGRVLNHIQGKLSRNIGKRFKNNTSTSEKIRIVENLHSLSKVGFNARLRD